MSERTPEKIISLNDLDDQDLERLRSAANWNPTSKNGVITSLRDERYGTINRVAVIDDNGKIVFDKLNIQWSPAVFVVTARLNPKTNRLEFLLLNEKRILLRDNKGEQGNVTTENIPQGAIAVWKNEKPHEAAIRELKEETGYTPVLLVFLGNSGMDIANSETLMPFYFALIPYKQKAQDQNLDETEQINELNWLTWQEIQGGRDLICGKTKAGLFDAIRIINPKLISPIDSKEVELISSKNYAIDNAMTNAQWLRHRLTHDVQ